VPTTLGPLCQRYPFFLSTAEERHQMFEAAPSATGLIVPTARLAQLLNERRQAMAC
jgi:hypothetical protein